MDQWLASPDELLESIDEFSLYCYYLGYTPELRTKYRSPLRDLSNPDDNPSFSLFESTKMPGRDYGWKDSGGVGRSGDIFALVQYLFGYSTRPQAVHRVKMDFLADRKELERKEPPVSVPAHIRIKSKQFTKPELDFWKAFGITPEQLVRYRVTSLSCYWLYDDQMAPSFPRRMGFAYHIYDKYQLYFPYQEPGRKFRHDTEEIYVPGMQQLSYSRPNLIITKSYKDIMLLDRFGKELNFEVIAVRSENTPFPPIINEGLRERYANICTLFDNDGKHRRDFFAYADRHLEVPKESGEKDPSDFYRKYGEKEFKEMLIDLIC